MKKYCILLIALVMVSCHGNVSKFAASSAAIVKNKDFTTTTLSGEDVYQYNGDKYYTYKYSVQWPTEYRTGDVKALQRFIIENLLDTTGVDVHTAIDGVARRFVYKGRRTDVLTYDQVTDMRNNKVDETQEFPWIDFTVELMPRDKKRNVIEAQLVDKSSLDNMLAAGDEIVERRVYYDCETGRSIKLDDLIDNHAAVLTLVKKFALSMPDDAGINDDAIEYLEKLPTSFYFTDSGMAFVFGKYEITYGTVNGVDVEVTVTDLLPYLTPTGKRLLQGK